MKNKHKKCTPKNTTKVSNRFFLQTPSIKNMI